MGGFGAQSIARAVTRWIGIAGAVLAGVGGGALIIMMLLGTADVAGTNLLSKPVPAMFEATETLLVIVVFAPLAYLQIKRRQIGVDLLAARFPPRLKTASGVLSALVGFLFFMLITWRGGMLAWQSWQVREVIQGLVNFPIYPSKILLVIGSGLVTLRAGADVIEHTYNLVKARPADTKTEPNGP